MKSTIQSPQCLLVASGGGAHRFGLKWIRNFAIIPQNLSSPIPAGVNMNKPDLRR